MACSFIGLRLSSKWLRPIHVDELHQFFICESSARCNACYRHTTLQHIRDQFCLAFNLSFGLAFSKSFSTSFYTSFSTSFSKSFCTSFSTSFCTSFFDCIIEDGHGVAVSLYAFVVLLVFFFAQSRYVGDFRKFAEDGILCQEWYALKSFHIVEYMNPTFKIILTFVLLLL